MVLAGDPGGRGASGAVDGPTVPDPGRTLRNLEPDRPGGQFCRSSSSRPSAVLLDFGARIAPGVNVGFSIDQSRTGIEMPLAMQSATPGRSRVPVGLEIGNYVMVDRKILDVPGRCKFVDDFEQNFNSSTALNYKGKFRAALQRHHASKSSGEARLTGGKHSGTYSGRWQSRSRRLRPTGPHRAESTKRIENLASYPLRSPARVGVSTDVGGKRSKHLVASCCQRSASSMLFAHACAISRAARPVRSGCGDPQGP